MDECDTLGLLKELRALSEEISDGHIDQAQRLSQVNADNLFGHNDWVSIAGGHDVNATSGTWSFDPNSFNTYDSLLVVLKDGNGIPNVYVGYLILEADGTSGTYTSPFKNPNNGNLKDVSHINYYGWIDPNNPDPVNPPAQTPLPPAALLFSSALGGLFFLRRRRKA